MWPTPALHARHTITTNICTDSAYFVHLFSPCSLSLCDPVSPLFTVIVVQVVLSISQNQVWPFRQIIQYCFRGRKNKVRWSERDLRHWPNCFNITEKQWQDKTVIYVFSVCHFIHDISRRCSVRVMAAVQLPYKRGEAMIHTQCCVIKATVRTFCRIGEKCLCCESDISWVNFPVFFPHLFPLIDLYYSLSKL